jgi:hypothetical protein
VTLNGEYQLTNGTIQPVTVTNARGTSAGWSVTGQVSDFKTDPAGADCRGGDANEYRLCIPGDNLDWGPSAGIVHTVIPGDVAAVDAGATGDLLHPWTRGLGTTAQTLCSSPVDQSGGTFQCNANLSLGVPASAGAGTYTANLTLTLA